MKLKCNDGVIRNFSVAKGLALARCKECGVTFGCHAAIILKPLFKSHVCKRMNKRRKKNA